MISVGLSARWTRLCVSIAVAFAFVCVLSAASALASQRGHVFSGTFGSPGTGPGQLKEPDGVAVNEETGMVYVADKGNDRVQWFNSKGEVQGEFNGSGELERENSKHVLEPFEGMKAGSGGGPDEEVTGRFDEPEGIAVDNSCAEQHPKLEGAECAKYDPSNGDVYVVDGAHKVVDKYSAAGLYLGQITGKTLGTELSPTGIHGVAVEPDGDVIVSTNTLSGAKEGFFRLSNGSVNVVLPLGGDPPGFTSKGTTGLVLRGVAVAGGDVFVFQQLVNEFVGVWSGSGGFLGEMFVGHVAGLVGESCTGDVYVDEGRVGEGVLVGRFSVSGEAVVSGVEVEGLVVPGGGGAGVGVGCLPGGASDVFVANAGAGVVDVYAPEPPGPPSVEVGSGFVSEVSGDGARLSATVDPRSEPGEEATSYEFEYGSCPAEGSCVGEGYGQSVEGQVPASYEPAVVSSVLRGLSAGTRYHYRVSAHNSQDGGRVVYGEELFFTTQSSFAGGLLDGRGYELVSEPDKRGAELLGISESGVVQASADGGALTYLASGATEAQPAGGANQEQVLSRRGGAGWESCDIGLPHEYSTGPSIGNGQEYRMFSEDLGVGAVQPFGRFVPLLAAGSSEQSVLLAGLAGLCGQHSSYRPLVSGCPEQGVPCERVVEEHEDVEPGTKFGEEGVCIEGDPYCGPEFQGANVSLSAVVLRAGKQTVLVGEAGGAAVPNRALYEWYGGRLYVVSTLGSGQAVGGEAHQPVLGTQQLAFGLSLRDAVSTDGSRVVWSENAGGEHLFVWDRATGKSVQVDTVQKAEGASGTGAVQPDFQFMTADGSKVFFTDTQNLTRSAGTVQGNEASTPDLYECEVAIEGEGEEAKPTCVLRDLTPETASKEHADVFGQAIGASSDASTIYFVANGVLAGGAVKGECEKHSGGGPSSEQCNLYELHDGTVALVAVLSGEDHGDWGGEEGVTSMPVQARLTGRVSASGEWLAFMSDRSLTGYDNRDVHSGKRDEEVYLYNSAGGGLVCVSCDPTGERPNGFEYKYLDRHGNVAGGHNVWPESTWIAGNVPGWTQFREGRASYQSRYLDEDGRMFFDSGDGLVPRDTNATEDVYEYEPAGVGDCGTENPSYLPQDKGCLGLISSGESPQESGFLDASENGNDVFFLTSSQLSKRDTDTSKDIYDARVGGIEPEEAKPVECQGDACQSPVSPPESLTPSSLTSNGPGNLLVSPAPGTQTKTKTKAKTRQQQLAKALKGCRKDRGKAKRKGCEKSAEKKYGAKRGKKRKEHR